MSGAGQGGLVRAVVAAAALSIAAPLAHAGDGAGAPDDLVARWWGEIARRIDVATPPPRTPPVPVAVKWASRRIAAVDLAAPLLALASHDLDGDGRGELIALTTRELIVLRRSGRREVEVVARDALPALPALQRSRDPVGTLVVAERPGLGVEVLARSSEQARGASWQLRDGVLVRGRELDGFPICGEATLQPHGGRNYFAAATLSWAGATAAPALPERLFDARCAVGLIDAEGAPYAELASIGIDGTLAVQRLVPCGAGGCSEPVEPVERVEVRNRGTSFAVADVDNDGDAEVLATTNRPPGRGDRVTVYTRDGDGLRRVARSKKFTGGVAAIAVGDLDGDGDRDVVAAVRLVGSNKVDLWALNR